MAKYIFVTGGVVSSLGKGIAAASLGCLLESRGLKVTLQKFDPYLNVDPGTMSPFQHGPPACRRLPPAPCRLPPAACLLTMGLLNRAIFREVAASALLGTVLFTFVLFLQRVGKLFEILVRSSAPPPTVAYLFGLAIPFTLTFTVPLGVLVGVLIALSRMSSDGEIIAMRAAGVPSRKVIAPVLTFAVVAMILAASASLWLTPWAARTTYRVLNRSEEHTSE